MRRMGGTKVMLPGLLLALGCAGIWWKAGAGTQELERDKAACRAAAPDAAGFEACMTELGWWYSPVRREATDPVAAAGDATRRFGTPAPAPAAAPSETSTSRAPQPAVEPGPVAITSAPPETKSAPAAATSDGATGSSQIFWKLGASAQQLERDQAGCLEQSGLRIERDSGPRWGESAAFDRCMCARGWRGGPC